MKVEQIIEAQKSLDFLHNIIANRTSMTFPEFQHAAQHFQTVRAALEIPAPEVLPGPAEIPAGPVSPKRPKPTAA